MEAIDLIIKEFECQRCKEIQTLQAAEIEMDEYIIGLYTKRSYMVLNLEDVIKRKDKQIEKLLEALRIKNRKVESPNQDLVPFNTIECESK